MIVRVIDFIGKYHFVPGPPDLAKYGEGYTITFDGEPTEQEMATWAIAVGLFVLRGGER